MNKKPYTLKFLICSYSAVEAVKARLVAKRGARIFENHCEKLGKSASVSYWVREDAR